MIRTTHSLVVVFLVFGLAAAAVVPGGFAEAAVDSVSPIGDCAGVQVTVVYSRFGTDDVYNDVSAWATVEAPPGPPIPISTRPTQVLGPGATHTIVFDITFGAPLPEGTIYVLHVDQWAGATVEGVPTELYYDSREEYITCVASTPDDPGDPPVIVPVPGGDEPPASREPAGAQSANRPGPEMVFMPSWSVMGQFVTATELLYAPDANAGTGVSMAAGKTLWVLGLDESGAYRQVVLNGSYLWVPAASMSPVETWPWNGRGLPGEVVSYTN